MTLEQHILKTRDRMDAMNEAGKIKPGSRWRTFWVDTYRTAMDLGYKGSMQSWEKLVKGTPSARSE